MTFLKTTTVDLDGTSVEITQVSGLDRFDFLDFCSELPQPAKLQPIPENPTEDDIEQYELANIKYMRAWTKINFVCQARLVAYGNLGMGENIEERHQQVMSRMTPVQVKFLHDEIARHSGMPLPEDMITDDSEPSADEITTVSSTTESEPVDPKA